MDTPSGISIDDRIQLLPGTSPYGYVYRLSNVFDEYPEAKVGSCMLDVTFLGYHKYKLAAAIQTKHLPILHWFAPNMELFTPKSNLVCPRRDVWGHFYENVKSTRYAFFISRTVMLCSIVAVFA